MAKVIIDGQSIEVEEGTTILQAARKIGGKLVPPAMCYYSKLNGSGGKCRSCLVKVSQTSTQNLRPMPKLVASCSTPVQDGMVVQNITSPEVLETRKAIVEFLLINHPLDCPVCDQAGECDLQNLSFEHGIDTTRFEESKREFEEIDIGPYVKLHMNRCILCYRCVFAVNQLSGGRVHGVLYRGDASEISTFIKNSITNEFSGNVIDVCPVGALTDRTFRFKSRVWFVKPMNVHRECPICSGKAVAWMHGDEVYRVTARKDEFQEVEEFICNTCRFEKKNLKDWVVEGPRNISDQSIISVNKYINRKEGSIFDPVMKHIQKASEQ
jgi:NADH-quinone oxidoreductase subunit G